MNFMSNCTEQSDENKRLQEDYISHIITPFLNRIIGEGQFEVKRYSGSSYLHGVAIFTVKNNISTDRIRQIEGRCHGDISKIKQENGWISYLISSKGTTAPVAANGI